MLSFLSHIRTELKDRQRNIAANRQETVVRSFSLWAIIRRAASGKGPFEGGMRFE